MYAGNAADLVELRVKPVSGATAFRVTVNSLKDAARTGFTIALGTSGVPRTWPHSAGVSSPAALFLTVHGTTAELRDAATNAIKTPSPTATVDLRRRQFDVRVPHAAWNPGNSAVRMAAGVGLWDPGAGTYLTPSASASATRPGGAATSNAALFNLAFRHDEPKPKISSPGVANTIAEGGVGVALDGTWWRERSQAEALNLGDVSGFSATVDFAKLAAGTGDESRVPKTGHFDRILPSRFSFGQGVDHSKACGLVEPADPCEGRYRGQLQPYGSTCRPKPRPAAGYGLTLLMHGLSANHNEFLDSRNAQQFGDRGTGSIVAAPFGRAPDGFYEDYAEADVFEVWADVARNYALDPSLAAVSGYSMGGIGTFRLITRWPDLFARGFPIVGYPSGSDDQLESLRNVPIMAWNAGPGRAGEPGLRGAGPPGARAGRRALRPVAVQPGRPHHAGQQRRVRPRRRLPRQPPGGSQSRARDLRGRHLRGRRRRPGDRQPRLLALGPEGARPRRGQRDDRRPLARVRHGRSGAARPDHRRLHAAGRIARAPPLPSPDPRVRRRSQDARSATASTSARATSRRRPSRCAARGCAATRTCGSTATARSRSGSRAAGGW